MNMLTKKIICSTICVLSIATGVYLAPERANAQLNVGNLLGGLFGGGGETVRIVDDVSPNTIINTIKTGLIEAANALISGQISSINLKETVLDPIAWQMAKQMQQQLTGEWVKWLGGQQPGQDGKKPYITDQSGHYESIMDQIYGDFINELGGSGNAGLCSEEERHQVQQAVISYYREKKQERDGGQIFSCSEKSQNPANQGSVLTQIFRDTVNCDGDIICAGLKAQRILAERQAMAISNENRLLDYGRGMLPQRVCRVINDPDGRPRQLCELTNAPFLASEAVAEQIIRAPSQQLLQMDEFNEVVSQFMSYLPNQLIQGFGGILSLVGDPEFANNIFGPDGDLSYLDAMLGDSVVSRQSVGSNPIKDALAAEQKYSSLQQIIVDEVSNLESQLSSAKSNGQCTSLSLNSELAQAKGNAAASLATSRVIINGDDNFPGLTYMDQQYTSTTDAGVRNSILTAFMEAKNQGAFRDQYQNQQFESSYINYTFAMAVDRFQCEIVQCGGAPASSCVLGAPST